MMSYRFSRWQPWRRKSTSGFGFSDVGFVAVGHASLVARTYRTTERWPCAIYDWCPLRGLAESVEVELSVWVHVFFSCEERMKVAKTLVREKVTLPIGTASYLMWNAFRGSGNGVERLFELVRRAVIYQSCRVRFICDIGVAVATAAAGIRLLWRRQLAGGGRHWVFVFVDGRSFLAGQESDNGSDVFCVKCWLDSR